MALQRHLTRILAAVALLAAITLVGGMSPQPSSAHALAGGFECPTIPGIELEDQGFSDGVYDPAERTFHCTYTAMIGVTLGWIPADSPQAEMRSCPQDGFSTSPADPGDWDGSWASDTHLAALTMIAWDSQAGDVVDDAVVAAVHDLAHSLLAAAEAVAAPCRAASDDGTGTESSGPTEIGPAVTAGAAGTSSGGSGGGVSPAVVGLLVAGAAIVIGAGVLAQRRKQPRPETAVPVPIAPTPSAWPSPQAEPPTELAAITADRFGGAEDALSYGELAGKHAPVAQRAYEAMIAAQRPKLPPTLITPPPPTPDRPRPERPLPPPPPPPPSPPPSPRPPA